MDILYDSDHKLGEMEDSSMGEILDHENFQSPTSLSSDGYMDNDWLDSLFEDPVLNDKMITDAVQPPRIHSEHSYSINDNSVPSSPLGLGKLEDLDSEFFGSNQALDLTNKTTLNPGQEQVVKTEMEPEMEAMDPMLTTVTTMTTRTVTVTKQPTIILAAAGNPHLHPQHSVSPPIVTIKTEPADQLSDAMEQTVNVDSLIMPPTPPSSASSDSEGGQSPQPSAPSSPIRQLPLSRHSHSPTSKSYSQPLFTSPIPQSGVLILSEEEKRTLISEGYPIPNKLPLTKQEEKNLKKIRRKIKNKISAQESRRKKKEYLEALEKRVEAFSQENNDLKKKVDSLENNNRSLLGQLQKLQALVGKVSRHGGATTQTGTVLMVLVLCFAVFLGSWTPSSFNIGYSSGSVAMDGMSLFNNPRLLQPGIKMGPSIQDAKVDQYSTPAMKSRVLLSLREEEDLTWYHPYGPLTPRSQPEFSDHEKESQETNQKDTNPTEPVVVGRLEVVTVDQRFHQANCTTRKHGENLHPEIISPMGLANPCIEKSVETETA
ncbi:cyclic AMP-responsive element-binding protein 3-like protein 1 isoform X1 [Crassostrea angulata]|uniref:cyclic AMP-responsive element-binding protein 3-like protein 1 isoform X1 n=1 Tax=Magallana angulata TaxID=2784310 RepID=UPI0022B2053B|nr:cyclic AMP-responsive element-binding protein 3-like protein 1 isoform X1 [Crassostrea angulata]